MPLLDLDAPIIPGHSAGGCQIGQSIDEVLHTDGDQLRQEIIHDYRGQPSGFSVYRSDAVDLWVHEDRVITQIGVHGAYHGKLFDQVQLGMTIDDLERLVGPCIEDDEDNLSIAGIRGLCFEVVWHRTQTTPDVLDFSELELRFSPVIWLFVYADHQ